MKKLDNVFKKMDLFFFNKVDDLKKKPDYSKVQEAIGRIDDEFKDVAKVLGTVAFFLVPLLIISSIFYLNLSMNKSIEIRKEFISLANEIISSNRVIGDTSEKIISTNPIEGAGGFNSRLSQILTTAGLDVEKIQVSNFVSEDIAGGIVRSEGDFRFTTLTTTELSNLFIALVAKEKMKVSTLSVRKNRKTNLLNGTFRVIHFSKSLLGKEDK